VFRETVQQSRREGHLKKEVDPEGVSSWKQNAEPASRSKVWGCKGGAGPWILSKTLKADKLKGRAREATAPRESESPST